MVWKVEEFKYGKMGIKGVPRVRRRHRCRSLGLGANPIRFILDRATRVKMDRMSWMRNHLLPDPVRPPATLSDEQLELFSSNEISSCPF